MVVVLSMLVVGHPGGRCHRGGSVVNAGGVVMVVNVGGSLVPLVIIIVVVSLVPIPLPLVIVVVSPWHWPWALCLHHCGGGRWWWWW